LSFTDPHCSFFDQTAKILLFYIVFYAALSGFFAAMLAVFYQTLHPKMPKWKLEESIIGTNPGELCHQKFIPQTTRGTILKSMRFNCNRHLDLWQSRIAASPFNQ
jgi:hypothetical protein